MITEKMIHEAHAEWGNKLVAIGKAKTEGQDFKFLAAQMIKELYNYDNGIVLFKPTKASQKQFRLTKESALSYFVGGDPNFPEDQGFALQPWTTVKFENTGFIIHDNVVLAMGNYFFTPLHGEVVKVEYTFGYTLEPNGKLMINLHHSSLPFQND
jgi:hypothetical protein